MTSRNGPPALALARQAAGTAGYAGASDDTRNRAALVVDHLSKDFGSRAAFSDVSFMVG